MPYFFMPEIMLGVAELDYLGQFMLWVEDMWCHNASVELTNTKSISYYSLYTVILGAIKKKVASWFGKVILKSACKNKLVV